MWIEREIALTLKKLAATFPILVLIGPRQTGKTSIIEKTFPSLHYVSLDLPQLAEAAETRPSEFLERHRPPLIIDEIQYAPAILRHIKAVTDRRRGEKGLFLLTGSQSFPLMRSVSESLAGRAGVIPFLGLSASEWNAAGFPKRFPPMQFLWKGGFPALWSEEESSPDRDRWYQGYLATYLERDVRNLLNVGSLRDFERFLRAAAVRTGRLLNMSDVGRDVGVSPTTAREWFGVLQASNQVFFLEPYHRSLGKRIVKSPKLYFTDTGLAAFLAGFEGEKALQTSPLAGFFWENHVVAQWLRYRDWNNPSISLWFWEDRMKNEVDFVVEKNQILYPIECKLKETPDSNDARGIRKFREFYGESVGSAFIACLADEPFDVGDGITAVSGWTPWDFGTGFHPH
jgi:hypothetical protein